MTKLRLVLQKKRPDVLNDAKVDLGYGLEEFMSAVRELAATSNDPIEAKKLIDDTKVLIKTASSFLKKTAKQDHLTLMKIPKMIHLLLEKMYPRPFFEYS